MALAADFDEAKCWPFGFQ